MPNKSDKSDNRQTNPTRRTFLQRSAVAAGGLTLGTAVFSGSAAADRWDIVFDLTGEEVDNPCTGETATVTSGTLRGDIDTRTDQSGGLHINATFQANAQLEGNDTGLLYNVSFKASQNLYVAADAMPTTETLELSFIATSQGSADNWRMKGLIKMTVDATGAEVVDMSMSGDKCI